MANTKVNKNSNSVGRPKGGKKLGGRKKGTPNKKTLEFIEALGSFDPVKALIDLYKKTEDDGIKLGALKEMLKYIYPQRKAVDFTLDPKDNRPIIEDNI